MSLIMQAAVIIVLLLFSLAFAISEIGKLHSEHLILSCRHTLLLIPHNRRL
jgi:hypothetical protein